MATLFGPQSISRQLQRIRSETEDAWKKIQPGLNADRAQMKLLGPAPAAGQPQEPEQAALGRAELNYHFGLLSAGQASVKSTNLRIDNLLNTIQEIRRKNFASVLFQPILASTPTKPGPNCRNMSRKRWARFAI